MNADSRNIYIHEIQAGHSAEDLPLNTLSKTLSAVTDEDRERTSRDLLDEAQPHVQRQLSAARAMAATAPVRHSSAGRGWAQIACGLVLALAIVGSADAQSDSPEEAPNPAVEELVEALESDPLSVLEKASPSRRGRILEAAQTFYENREGRWAWSGRSAAPSAAARIDATLEGAIEHGLRPKDYRAATLSTQLQDEPSIATEAAATLSLLLYGEHLSRGRFDPEDFDIEWFIEPKEIDLAVVLESFRSGNKIEELAPSDLVYRDLQAMLASSRAERLEVDDLPPIPDGETISSRGRYAPQRLALLADRLRAHGAMSSRQHRRTMAKLVGDSGRTAAEDENSEGNGTGKGTEEGASGVSMLEPDLADDAVLANADPVSMPRALQSAVRRFQKRFGMKVDGMVGPRTLARLNETSIDRVERLVINLERSRWLPERPEGRFLRVNVPAFEVEGFDGNRRVFQSPVVVGKPSWVTPIFRDSMSHVVVNPYWNVPSSIAVDETLPAIREDVTYLDEKDFELVDSEGSVIDPSTIEWQEVDGSTMDFRFRQRPGPKNALGQIKFLFPNQHSVYLHDTPSRRAFERNRRDLSHGCVRVERYLELAEFVFEGTTDWDRKKVRKAIRSGERQWINLDEEIPVWIVYFTAYRGADGQPELTEDIYGYDAVVAEALVKRYGEESFFEATAQRSPAAPLGDETTVTSEL